MVPEPLEVLIEAEEPTYIPLYKTEGAACMDIRAAENVSIEGCSTAAISAGFKVRVPDGYEMQIRSRSGKALDGVVVANQPGTIDSDYRGTVKVLLHNNNDCFVEIRKGERIAQVSLHPTVRVRFSPGRVPSDTERGAGGFGSTGSG